MEWRDEGSVLAVRPHGEHAAIVELFTAEHGRHVGVVRGGASRKMAPILQPGAQVQATWKARLEDHMGAFTIEPLRSRAGDVLGDRLALSGLNAICALLSFSLPEREAHPALYQRTQVLLDLLPHPDAWPLAYLRWEVALLDELGFGLDLTRCAVTGSLDDLAYVSPKTGRAVSAEGAGKWADRLLPLPYCLLGQGPVEASQIVEGLTTTGHFLRVWLAPSLGNRPLPEARARLFDQLQRYS
ncbi:DNA recombination protein RecO [Actibacterium mucosum KCTC 23349]|uniref:DNA repair protein RecO n=1 Tax=Actibacterium mucosum KCTC 23349 TaxID=1454373 RepID=A0A037ZQ31_9RHOB|nr:DNA repair protein RecO [Actibacterium mucosum]KAJ56922.1 DNA recombination protein RecO [Actibacterium mucosum KCTC 23349]